MNDKNKVGKIEIKPVSRVTNQHWKLLLLADPSKSLVQKYLQLGNVFEICKFDIPIAIMVLQADSQFKLEVKNIAVDPKFENQGLATQLLQYAFCFAKKYHYQQLQIGTGSTSFKQLYLYQKMGFRVTGIKKNFFVENYEQPIYENGLLLQDMLILTANLNN